MSVPRHLVVAALEVGEQAEAVELLLDALDYPIGEPPVCPVCGQRAWPGDAVRHIFSRHHRVELERAA